MFSKTLFFVISFFTLLVSATVTTTITEHPPVPSPTDSASCSQVGFTPLCCLSSIGEVPAPGVTTIIPHALFGLLAIVITPGIQILGLSCAPIVGGVCSGTVLCCENTSCGPLVNIGCVNIVI